MLQLRGWMAVSFVLAGVAADWPQFLGPNRNATSPETGLLTTWPPKGPPLLWEHEVGEGFSCPVVAGDRLLMFHAVSGRDVLECLDPATGKVRWKAEYPSDYTDDLGKGNGPRTTPLIAGEHAYTLGALGQFHCWDLNSGKKIWQRDLLSDYNASKGFFGVGAGLLLDGNVLLVNIGGRAAGIVALDAATGKELWKATDHEASYATPVAATIDGVRHALFFTREGLVSLDPRSGEVRFSKRWRSRMNASVNAATPVIGGDLVFVSASYGTGALTARIKKDGVEEVWKRDGVLSCHFNTPVYCDGFLYGIDGRQEGRETRLVCVDLKTGKESWARERFGCAAVIAVDGHLLLLNEDGELVLVQASPERYKEKARATVLTGPVRSELALANGRLFARDGKKLVCFKLAN